MPKKPSVKKAIRVSMFDNEYMAKWVRRSLAAVKDYESGIRNSEIARLLMKRYNTDSLEYALAAEEFDRKEKAKHA